MSKSLTRTANELYQRLAVLPAGARERVEYEMNISVPLVQAIRGGYVHSLTVDGRYALTELDAVLTEVETAGQAA